jgi:hypothetical protein
MSDKTYWDIIEAIEDAYPKPEQEDFENNANLPQGGDK